MRNVTQAIVVRLDELFVQNIVYNVQAGRGVIAPIDDERHVKGTVKWEIKFLKSRDDEREWAWR